MLPFSTWRIIQHLEGTFRDTVRPVEFTKTGFRNQFHVGRVRNGKNGSFSKYLPSTRKPEWRPININSQNFELGVSISMKSRTGGKSSWLVYRADFSWPLVGWRYLSVLCIQLGPPFPIFWSDVESQPSETSLPTQAGISFRPTEMHMSHVFLSNRVSKRILKKILTPNLWIPQGQSQKLNSYISKNGNRL